MDEGTHFFRTDFQVHTPRDANWTGERPITDDDRSRFAKEFVAACRTKGLQAVAITDHHDFAFYRFIRVAAENELDASGNLLPVDQQLVVFPGLELRLGVPCQALLILDAAFPLDQLSLVLEALAITQVDSSEARLPPVTPLNHIESFAQLHDEMNRREWLRDHYIVFPNVTDGGYGTLMRHQMQAKYIDMPCVGGYIDGTVGEKVGIGNRRIFAGQDPAWGNKRIALFQTSDSRGETFEDLGKHSTWVKWATPTAEALRQACLAQESRISHEVPPLPTTYITRLSVSNSRFMGPIELELNAQYNAIIGGRGTGKSTILEYIRWALCDDPVPAAADDELSDQAARRQRLITSTLAAFDAHIDVHFNVNGIEHTVRRRSAKPELMLKVADAEFRPATEGDVRSLLPIQAYSQKQLSSVSVRRDELVRFVTSPIRGALEDIDGRASRLSASTRENYAALQHFRTLSTALKRDELTTESLTQQAANLRGSLDAVSDEDRQVLSAKPQYDLAVELATSWARKLEQLLSETEEFQTNVSALQAEIRGLPQDGVPARATMEALELAIRLAFDSVGSAATEIHSVLEQIESPDSAYSRALAEVEAQRGAFDERYNAAKERSSANESKLAELAQLEERTRSLRESVEQQREELARLGNPHDEHVRLRQEWLVMLDERSSLLEAQCVRLTAQSDGLIRATLRKGAGLTQLREAFGSAIRGSGARSERIAAFFEQACAEEGPIATWEAALAELEPGHQDEETSQATAPTLTGHGFAETDVQRMRQRLTPEAWLGLALSPIEDFPQFEYQTKPAEYIAFNDASAGQQATALLRVLLNQAGPPLIVDQPEEDLDSEIVLEIVEQLWIAKCHRQLVFASHNPNLVVNGDAELVICCSIRTAGDHSGGRIKLEGAIDVPRVRQEITTVMEGGEKAFRLRKEKYGF